MVAVLVTNIMEVTMRMLSNMPFLPASEIDLGLKDMDKLFSVENVDLWWHLTPEDEVNYRGLPEMSNTYLDGLWQDLLEEDATVKHRIFSLLIM